MANVCFGCRDVENIEKCPKKDCVHYENRDSHLKMDTVNNEQTDKMIKRNFRFVIGV